MIHLLWLSACCKVGGGTICKYPLVSKVMIVRLELTTPPLATSLFLQSPWTLTNYDYSWCGSSAKPLYSKMEIKLMVRVCYEGVQHTAQGSVAVGR